VNSALEVNSAIHLALFTVKKNCVFFIQKIRRKSLDDVTKNSVFIVARLRNHEKYSSCFVDFVRDEIAHSLME
jgi:hypothetical protein